MNFGRSQATTTAKEQHQQQKENQHQKRQQHQKGAKGNRSLGNNIRTLLAPGLSSHFPARGLSALKSMLRVHGSSAIVVPTTSAYGHPPSLLQSLTAPLSHFTRQLRKGHKNI